MPAGVGRLDPGPGAAVVVDIGRAVDGCLGAHFDERRGLLFVWRADLCIYTYSTATGELMDQPWPLDPQQVTLMGMSRAAGMVISERINAGYLPGDPTAG